MENFRNVDSIVEWMGRTGADVLSIEPKASTKLAQKKCGPNIILMGGVDTGILFMQDSDAIKQACEKAISDGIQILAPGCAVTPGTPTENLTAMVKVANSTKL